MSKSEPRSDLAVLIRDLAARHHKGILYRMAPRVGLSMSLLDQWSKGLVREPSLGSLRKLAAAYGLDLSVVLEAAYPELRKKAATSVSRRLAGVLLAIGLGWAAVDPHPVDAARGPWTAHPLPAHARLVGRGIMSSWRWRWAWWGAVADSYLAVAWRRGLTSFRAWPVVSIDLHGA